MVPLLSLVLQFHRKPLAFPHLMKAEVPLPDVLCEELGAAGRALSGAQLPRTAEALGVRPEQLREAFRFFVQHCLLVPGAEPRRILGLPQAYSLQMLKQHHGMLLRLLHPDRAVEEEKALNAALSARINRAYCILRAQGQAVPMQSPSWKGVSGVRVPISSDPLDFRPRFKHTFRYWRWGGLLGLLSMLFLWWFVYQERVTTRLQINPAAARPALAKPAFLLDFPELPEEKPVEPQDASPFPAEPDPAPIMATVLQPILPPDAQAMRARLSPSVPLAPFEP